MAEAMSTQRLGHGTVRSETKRLEQKAFGLPTVYRKRNSNEIMLAIIGQIIRQLREENGISPEELASRAGISVEKLDKIERNETTPSLRILLRLSRALGGKLGTFLGGQEEDRTTTLVRREELAEHPVFAGNEAERNGRMRFYALAQTKNDRHMEPLVIEIAPGETTTEPERRSEHTGEEFLHVLEGEATLYYGDEVYCLKPGDSIYYNSVVPHVLSNETPTPVRVLAVLYMAY